MKGACLVVLRVLHLATATQRCPQGEECRIETATNVAEAVAANEAIFDMFFEYQSLLKAEGLKREAAEEALVPPPVTAKPPIGMAPVDFSDQAYSQGDTVGFFDAQNVHLFNSQWKAAFADSDSKLLSGPGANETLTLSHMFGVGAEGKENHRSLLAKFDVCKDRIGGDPAIWEKLQMKGMENQLSPCWGSVNEAGLDPNVYGVAKSVTFTKDSFLKLTVEGICSLGDLVVIL